MLGPDAAQRSIADHSGARIDQIDITTIHQLQNTQQWCEIFAPDLVTKIRALGDENDEISAVGDDLITFIERGLMEQINGLLQPYALLPGGGNIIIQPTAALSVIDVNSSRDRRGALAINLEAATEAARQIKLRNLGGAIIIDFLKMTQATQRRRIVDHLQRLFDDDPCTVDIHGFTRLGLLELTRNRRTPSLAERMTTLHLVGD
jgi:Rne/Rng family ribonuclease